VESFVGVADLMVESQISILCGKIDDVVVKKDYVLLSPHVVKGMVAML
jgi:hypothetical protein